MMLGAAIFVAGMAVAAQVRPVNLEEMTLRADRIFAGRCIGVEVVHEATSSGAGDIAQVTFRVDRAVKGSLGEDVVLKVTSGDDGRGGGTSGVPSFRPGDEVVLFLYGESALGLSSPWDSARVGSGSSRTKKDAGSR
jgi:hypothetical protein